MNPAEMIVLIVLIVTVAGVLKARMSAGRPRGSDGPDEAGIEQENRELRRELRAMQERLAVLERLATEDNDTSARLDREIERLRDRPRIERGVDQPRDTH